MDEWRRHRYGRRCVLFGLALLAAQVPQARADDDDDDDDDGKRAGRAVAQGQARPLTTILGQLRNRLNGDIVGIEFKRKNGRYVYKLKVATSTGRLREVMVDAASGTIVNDEDD